MRTHIKIMTQLQTLTVTDTDGHPCVGVPLGADRHTQVTSKLSVSFVNHTYKPTY